MAGRTSEVPTTRPSPAQATLRPSCADATEHLQQRPHQHPPIQPARAERSAGPLKSVSPSPSSAATCCRLDSTRSPSHYVWTWLQALHHYPADARIERTVCAVRSSSPAFQRRTTTHEHNHHAGAEDADAGGRADDALVLEEVGYGMHKLQLQRLPYDHHFGMSGLYKHKDGAAVVTPSSCIVDGVLVAWTAASMRSRRPSGVEERASSASIGTSHRERRGQPVGQRSESEGEHPCVPRFRVVSLSITARIISLWNLNFDASSRKPGVSYSSSA